MFSRSRSTPPPQATPPCWSPTKAKKYAIKDNQGIVAIQMNLELETDEFRFEKWGGTQTCKRNDWLVHNLLDGDTYVVDGREGVFNRTYRPCGPGRYRKVGHVYAVRADEAGRIATKEGETAYRVGDYVVGDRPEGGNFYAMEPDKFHEKYVDAEGGGGAPLQATPPCWSPDRAKKYAIKDNPGVVAIQVNLDLECDGFKFEKWGSVQTCKKDDWLVFNLLDDDTYVVDGRGGVFNRTYAKSGPGRYKKSGHVYAVRAEEDGFVATKEGRTAYRAGDFVVGDRPEGGNCSIL